MMEHYIRNEAEMSQDAPNHTKNKTRKLPVPHRTRLTPAAREEQIINVAAAHFARRGVVGASMLDIAKEAGITRALLYHYFPGKESLAAAVTRREARAVLETLSEHHEDPQEALHTALHVYFDRVAGRGTEATSDVQRFSGSKSVEGLFYNSWHCAPISVRIGLRNRQHFTRYGKACIT